MSEKVSIQESGKTRNFSGIGVIETETPEGDSVFWVPESERELETEYVIKNGTYRPQKYGFSDINVNVFDLTTDLDGNDWKIDIGDIDVPDVQMPDISLPDFDIDLSLDIDDIGDMPSIDLTIDGVKLDLPDLSETIDLDAGFDVSLDVDDASGLNDIGIDISGSDLDGLPIDVNIDLDTLDMNTFDLPDEIRIMHVPNKTSYKDGEEIDLDGIEVKAFRNGEVWEGEDGKYWQGYIPVHELTTEETKSDYYRSIGENGESIIWGTGEIEVKGVFQTPRGEFSGTIKIQPPSGARVYLVHDGDDTKIILYVEIPYGLHQEPPLTMTAVYTSSDGSRQYSTTMTATSWWYNQEDGLTYWRRGGRYFRFEGIQYPLYLSDECEYSFPVNPYFEPDPASTYSNIVWNSPGGSIGKSGTVTVLWPRPHDNKILTASFDITVEENDGAAQSNTEPGGGHSGGTTVSGDHGGSHHSGNF